MILNKYPNVVEFTEMALSSQGQNLGLIHGDTGTSIVLYLLSKAYKKKALSNSARKFIEAVSANSESITKLNFEFGFVGIGWAIEWMIEQGFISDMDSDEILSSIDQELYKSISFSRQIDHSLFKGTLGFLKYFEKRLAKKNLASNRYSMFGNLEAFVFLTDDLESKVINSKQKFDKDIVATGGLSFDDLGVLLVTCSSSMKLNVNSLVLETILYETMEYCEGILSAYVLLPETQKQKDKRLLVNYFNLSLMFYIAAKHYNHINWMRSAESKIEVMADSVIAIQTRSCELLIRRLSTLCILCTIKPNASYKLAAIKCLNNLRSKDLPIGISNGLGKLVLAELCLEKPELLLDWNELFMLT